MHVPRSVSHLLVLLALLTQPTSGGLFDWLVRLSPKQYFDLNELIYSSLGEATKINSRINVRAKLEKRQSPIPDHVPFPCDVTNGRSSERPTSVHALRPGDVDVVAAMGDSLTSAFGALAVDILNVYVGNRGVSFSIGGQETWRTALTLPNILKQFNPQLVGFSTGDSLSWQQPSQFNVAEAFSISQDMPHQASVLIKRMKADVRVNFAEDWKMITMMIGYNDICSFMCYENLDEFFENQRASLMEALNILHDQMPRVFVNIVPVANVNRVFFAFTEKPGACHAYNSVECSCVNGLQFLDRRAKHNALIDAVVKFDEEVTRMERYRDKDDFAVLVQPFTTDIVFPTRRSRVTGKNVTDYTFLAPDCYHFSQKGHAAAANALWNNLLESVGHKSRDWSPQLMSRFLCPSKQHPFIYTAFNTP